MNKAYAAGSVINKLYDVSYTVVDKLYDITYTGTSLTHNHIWNYAYDDNYHWKVCSICGQISGKTAHSLASNGGGMYYCADAYDRAFRYVCGCGYRTKPLIVLHGRNYNYDGNPNTWYSCEYGHSRHLGDIMQITRSQFNSWYGSKKHGSQAYTWYDYDGDGYGHVFCGGPMAGVDSGQTGTLKYWLGSEGDKGRHVVVDEYCALASYIDGDSTPTRDEFVAWMRNRINAKGTGSKHALYGYPEKYARVSVATFNKIVSEFADVNVHAAGWGWNWTGWTCTTGLHACNGSGFHGSLGGGNNHYDSKSRQSNSWTDYWNGQAVTDDVVNTTYTGTEYYTATTWFNPVCLEDLTSQPSGTVTSWYGPWNRLGKNQKLLGQAYARGKRVGHKYYMQYNIVASNGGKILTKYADDITNNGSTVLSNWVEFSPYDSAQKHVSWSYPRSYQFQDTTGGNYTNMFTCGGYWPRIDDTAPVAYNKNAWTVAGNGTSSRSSVQATVTVYFSDLNQFSSNSLSVHLYESDGKTVIPQLTVDNEWVPMIKTSNITGTDGTYTTGIWKGTLQVLEEVVGSKTIYAQAKDATGRLSDKVPITISYIDSRGPVLEVQNVSNVNAWSTSKVYAAYATDMSSVYYIGISEPDMKQVNGYTVCRYTFTGNINAGSDGKGKSFTFWGRDSAGNVSYKALSSLGINVKWIDNTSPTLTVTGSDTGKARITVTADDYCSSIAAQGSGKTPDGTGKYGFYYGMSNTPNVEDAVWSQLQTAAKYTYDVTEPGYYYFWVKDYVGNLSVRKQLFVDKFRLDLEADPVYGHSAASYTRYVFASVASFVFNAADIDTRRDNLTYNITFDTSSGAVLTDKGNTGTSSDKLKSGVISTVRRFNGWHMDPGVTGRVIGVSQTPVNVVPDSNRLPGFTSTVQYSATGNVDTARFITASRSMTLHPGWDNATLRLPDASRHTENVEYVSGNAVGRKEDLFLGWFTNPQPANGKSGNGGWYIGKAGDVVVVTGDMTLYPWFNVAPEIYESPLGGSIHDGALGDGFFEGQRVTYDQLLSLVNARDFDDPQDLKPDAGNTGNYDGSVSYNGLRHFIDQEDIISWREYYNVSELSYLNALNEEYSLGLSAGEMQSIVDTVNHELESDPDRFLPYITGITYEQDGTDLDGNKYPAGEPDVRWLQSGSSVKNDGLLSNYLNVGRITIHYAVTDNGAFSDGLKIMSGVPGLEGGTFGVDSPVTVHFDIATNINFNSAPRIKTMSTYVYTGDESLTSDTIEQWLWRKQDASDKEDDSDRTPWWYASETAPLLDESLRAVSVYDIEFSSGFLIEHPLLCSHMQDVNTLDELFSYKDMSAEEVSSVYGEATAGLTGYDIFSHISSFNVEWDCVDQWGKTASGFYDPGFDYDRNGCYNIGVFRGYYTGDGRSELPDVPAGGSMSVGERSMTVIMTNNRDDIELLSSGISVQDRVRYIDSTWLSYMDSGSYWGDERYGKKTLSSIFRKYSNKTGGKSSLGVDQSSGTQIMVNDYSGSSS